MSAGYDSFVRDNLPLRDEQPDFLFDLPELQYPDRLNAAVELLAGGAPDDTAVLNNAGHWSYRELDDWSSRIAQRLMAEEGLIPGNRVLLAGRNSAALFAAWLGVLKAGGVVVAVMPILRGGEIAKVVAKGAISHAIVDAPCRAAFEEAVAAGPGVQHALHFDSDAALGDLDAPPAPDFVPVDTHRDYPALIAFTSGTTGDPKGCVHFHRDILASADSFARHVLKPRRGARWACTAPLAFTFGLGMQLVFPLRFGGCAVTLARPGQEGLVDAIALHRVTICATAPTAYRAMLGMLDTHDLSSLETCVSAGEHLPEATWHSWHEATGLKIVDGIGATEMMHIFISASGNDIRPGATGRAVPGYAATVLDDHGAPMAQGTGRLAVKGPTGCRYLADPRQQVYVRDGWNITGDTYRLDEDGYFWFVARSDDMIISSGYNIAAPEVEQALYTHPAVAECAVVGVACEERGQLVKAFVVVAEGYEAGDALAAQLQAHVKQAIAPYKYPRAVAFTASLPKTATGKLRRFELR